MGIVVLARLWGAVCEGRQTAEWQRWRTIWPLAGLKGPRSRCGSLVSGGVQRPELGQQRLWPVVYRSDLHGSRRLDRYPLFVVADHELSFWNTQSGGAWP